MVYTLKRIIVYLLIASLLALFIYFVITAENKSFNAAGNIFSNSDTAHTNRNSKDAELTDKFWTNGRFNFDLK